MSLEVLGDGGRRGGAAVAEEVSRMWMAHWPGPHERELWLSFGTSASLHTVSVVQAYIGLHVLQLQKVHGAKEQVTPITRFSFGTVNISWASKGTRMLTLLGNE